MRKILICVDGSPYADKICNTATWAAMNLQTGIDILHVLRRESTYQDPPSDHTGSIGLSSRDNLMSELAKVDEERGKFDQKKGRLILDHAETVLRASGIAEISTIYRRGSLSETIKEIEENYDLIVIGKYGEQANLNSTFLGSNLEKVARIVTKPLLAVASAVRPIKSFVIAFDGKESAKKAVHFASHSAMLKGLECHLVAVECQEQAIDLGIAETNLKAAGFSPTIKKFIGHNPVEAITTYVSQNGLNLLLVGAYSHSRLRATLLGSTTSDLIISSKVPLLLFR